MHPTLLFAILLAVLLCGCAMSNATGPDIRTEVVTYSAGGANCTGYIAWDARKSGKRPGVLVVHEWWGHNEYVRRRARMLAELGYTAMALDMYGDGKQASHPKDAEKFMNEVLGSMDIAMQRFEGAEKVLRAHATCDRGHVAAIGYCFGGALVLNMARLGKGLDAVVSFHGNLATKTPVQRGDVKGKVLVCHGGADEFIPKAQVDAFEREMRAAGVDYRVITFPGAKHGFTSLEADQNGKQFGLPLAYDRAADEQSWAAMRDLFASVWR
jgi:dienelactone hydrolase